MIANEREVYKQTDNIIKKSVFKKKLADWKKDTNDLTHAELIEIMKELNVDQQKVKATGSDGNDEPLFNAKRNLGAESGLDEEKTAEDKNENLHEMINKVRELLAERERERKEFEILKEKHLHEYINGYRWERLLSSNTPNQEFLDLLDEVKYRVNNKQ